jgi:uncharacterized protein (DUF849 family)
MPVKTATATLITVAPTGAEVQKAAVPALPVTLDELVTTAKECQAAGAAVIHVHIRDDQARPTLDPVRLADTVRALRETTDLIVQLSTGGAVTDPLDHRLAVLDAAPDACSLTCGTVNFGDDVFMNSWPFIRELYARTQQLGVVPEFELFDLGHIATLHRLLDDLGAPAGGHVHCDLVMGVPGGMPGDAATLVAAVAALPAGSTWSATASAAPRCRSCWPRWPPEVTCGSAWRTPRPSPAAARSPGTRSSWPGPRPRPSWPSARPWLRPPRGSCSACPLAGASVRLHQQATGETIGA